MSLFSWLRSLATVPRRKKAKQENVTLSRLGRQALLLEALEDRLVPVAYTWAGLAAGTYDWNVAANWSPNTGFPNGPGDTAALNVALTGNVIIQVPTNVSVNTLTAGPTGNFTQTIVSTGGSITIDNGAGNGTITNTGTANVSTFDVTIRLASDTTLTNNTSRNFTFANIDLGSDNNLTVNAGNTANTTSLGNITGTGNLNLNRFGVGATAVASIAISGNINADITGTGTITVSGDITGNASLNKTGSGTGALILAGNNTYNGATSVSAGMLQIGTGATGQIGGGNLQIGGSATVTVNRTNAYTINNTITGAGNLVVSGAAGNGTLTADSSAFSGTVTVSAGTLNLRDTGRLSGAAAITIGNGTIVLDNQGANNLAGRLGMVPLNFTGTGGLTLHGANDTATTESFGNITLANGSSPTIRSRRGNGTGTNAISIPIITRALGLNLAQITFDGSALFGNGTTAPLGDVGANNSIVIADTTGLEADGIIPFAMTTVNGTIAGSGVLGGTGGFARLTASNAVVSATTALNPMNLTPTDNALYTANVVLGNGTQTANSVFIGLTAARALSGPNSTLVANAIGAGFGAFVATVSVPTIQLTGNGTLFASQGITNLTLSGNISQATTLTKEGLSNAFLSGSNFLGGPTVFNSGFLNVNGPGSLAGSSAFNFGGGTLRISANSVILAPVTVNASGGGIQVATAAITATVEQGITLDAGANLTWSGAGDIVFDSAITGLGGMNFTSTGAVDWRFANTYEGGTTLASAALHNLRISSDGVSGPFGLGLLTIVTGVPTLNAVDGARVLDNPIAALSNVNLNSFDFTLNGNISINAARTFTINSPNVTMTGALTGGFGITKAGLGRLLLSNDNNNFTTTTITAGILEVGDGITGRPGTSSVAVSAGATAIYNSPGLIANQTTATGAGNWQVLNGTNLTFNGTSTATGNWIVSGNGTTLTFTGAGTAASGNVAVGPGSTLRYGIGTTGMLGVNVNVQNDGDFQINRNTAIGTFGGRITGSGNFTFTAAAAAATITLSANNSYTGNTTINAPLGTTINITGRLPNTPNITVNSGLTATRISMTNTGGSPTSGRFGPSTANIALNGSVILEMIGNNTLNTSEFLGPITLNQLANVTLRSTRGNAGGAAALTVASLTKASDNVMLVFDGAVNGGGSNAPLTAAGNNTITITDTTGLPAAGTIFTYGMVTVGGTVNGNGALGGTGGFATLSGNRIVSATDFVTNTRFDVAAPTPAPAGANVLVLSTVALAGDTNVLNSVFLGGTVANTLSGPGNTLNARHIGGMGGGNVAYIISVTNLNLGAGATPATYFFNATGTGNMQIDSRVSGSGGLNKEGLGSARALFMPNANNSYTGVTTVNGGVFEIRNNNSLGAAGPGNHTVVGPNAQLSIGQGNLVVPENLTMNASLLMDILGNNTLTGIINVVADSRVSVATAANRLTLANDVVLANANLAISSLTATSNTTFAGNISGAGNITQNSTATTIFSGTNTYNGNTTVLAGVLALGNNGTSGTLGNGTVQNNATITFNRTDTLTVGNNISGNGSLVQFGNGSTILSGNNTYTGNTSILAGSLLVSGTNAFSPMNVALNGTLGGIGVLGGNVSVNGTLAPGVAGPGTLNLANLTLSDGARFAVELGSGQTDRVNAFGNITIGSNVSLNFSLFGGFVPSGNTSFTLIDNDDIDPINGTFQGLPEGAALLNFLGSGSDATITYVGGDGNDVVLSITGPSNVAPTVTPANGTLAYVENDGARPLDNALFVGDVDSPNLIGAAIVFSGGYVMGQDVLTFADQNGINGTFTAANGTLVLVGSSSVANYQTAMRSVTYTNNSESPSPANRTLSLVVSDGISISTVANRTITVAAVNDAPTLTATVANATFTSGAGPIAIDNLIAAADLDSATLSGATITITANFTAGQDVLAFANTANITGVYSPANGTLTLTGVDTVANFQAALRSVTYNNTNALSPNPAPRAISFQANDGAANNSLSNTAARTVAIVVTAPPVVTANQSFALAENTPNGTTVGTVLATDPDGPTTFQNWLITGGNTGGAFAINAATGQISVNNTLALDREALASFNLAITVSDGIHTSAAQSVLIQLNDVNDVVPVVTANQSFSVVENSPNGTAVGAVLATDGDITPTTFQNWTITSGNPGGAFAINPATGAITVADISGLSGNISLGVTVNDGVRDSAAGIVTIQLLSGNFAPVITAGQSFAIAENSNNGTGVGNVLATDLNPNTTLQSWTITAGNTSGAFAINATTGQITVANRTILDREAIASFNLTLTVSDGTDTSTPQNVTINLNDVNDVVPLITANQTFTLPENTGNGALVGTANATDGDVTPTTFANWTITGGTGAGIFAINATTGQITVANSTALNREVTAAFTLQVTARDGVNTSAAQNLTINLTDVNDVPPVVTANQTFTLPENTGNGTLVGTANATDGDVTPTTFANWTITGGNGAGVFAINATTGQITVANSTALNREATAAFTLQVTVRDGVNTSAAQNLTINLTDVNDVLPVVTANQTFSLPENSGNGTVVGTANATDGDATPTTFANWTITGGNGAGVFAINATTGQITVANSTALNREATAAFTLQVTVRDGVNTSAAQNLTINLTDVNDLLPVVTANQTFSLPENTGNGALVGTTNATDGDVTPTTFANWTVTGGNTGGAFAVNATTGQITVANSTVLNREAIASFALNMTVSDGVNTSVPRIVTINLTDVNDVAPIITAGQNYSVSQGIANGSVVGSVLATDGDVTPTTFQNWTIAGGNTGGAFALNAATGQLTVANNASLAGNFTLSLTVSDGVQVSAAQNVTINVTPYNAPPTIGPAAGLLNYVENDGGRVLDAAFAVGDDGGALTGATIRFTSGYVGGQDLLAFANQSGISGAFNPANGTMTLTGNASLANYQTALRSITYTNNSDTPSTANRTLSIVVNDGAQPSAAATRTIAVASVNDAPALAASAGNVTYTSGSPAIVIDSGLLVADADSRNFTGATVTISGSFSSGQDVLAFVNQFGISGSYNSANGTLTLTGAASLIAYQTALRTVTYFNSSPTPSTATRTISFRLNDGAAANNLSNIAQRFVQVSLGVNQPPNLTPIADRAFPLLPAAGNVTLNATDPENGPLTYGASLDSVGHFLRSTYSLTVNVNALFLNYGGQQDKWFSAPGGVWYFILPNGDFYRWNGVLNSATGTKLHTVNPIYHTDVTRIRDESAGPGPIVAAVSGNVISFTNATSYQGQFRVTATASDGVFTDSESFFVSFFNLPPALAAIGDQAMPPTQDTIVVAMSAPDPEGAAVSLVASVQSQAQMLDAQHAFAAIDAAKFNYGRLAEKWIFAMAGAVRTDYYILPSGDLFRWDQTPLVAQGTFLANVGTRIYADPNLLVAPTVAATASFAGNNLTVDPVSGFAGRLLVSVQATDAAGNSSAQTFNVLVAPPPTLTQPIDRNSVGAAPIFVTLSALDPFGLPLTYSAVSEAILLKNTYGLGYSQSPTHYVNFLGFGERWMIGAGANIWYYVKPNGDLFRWVGATGVSTFVRTIDTRYHANPALLYGANTQASIQVSGNLLTVTPLNGYTGKIVITAAANNGVFQDAKTFTITIS